MRYHDVDPNFSLNGYREEVASMNVSSCPLTMYVLVLRHDHTQVIADEEFHQYTYVQNTGFVKL